MSSVVYRNLRPDEEEEVLRLWVEVLGDDLETRRRLFHDFADEPQRFKRTHVAVAADGTLLAATAYWLRYLRDRDNQPCRTGYLWGVATRPEVRRQGHAQKLLDVTVNAMQQDACQWSILFTRSEARQLYARAGWHGVAHNYRAGIVQASEIPTDTSLLVYTIDPEREGQIWQRLAPLYAEANAERPFTMIRTDDYWRGYATWVLAEWTRTYQAHIFVAAPQAAPNDWCGYAIAHFYDAAYAQQNFGSPPWLFISEIGVRNNDTQTTAALLNAVTHAARQQAMPYGQLVLPDEAPLNAVLNELFGESLQWHQEQGSMMVRALTPDAPDLPSSDGQNSPFFWGLDEF